MWPKRAVWIGGSAYFGGAASHAAAGLKSHPSSISAEDRTIRAHWDPRGVFELIDLAENAATNLATLLYITAGILREV